MNKNALTRDSPALTLMDYGRLIKPFSLKSLLGLGRQFGQIKFGAFEVFLADLSAPIFFGNVNLLFSINQLLFL